MALLQAFDIKNSILYMDSDIIFMSYVDLILQDTHVLVANRQPESKTTQEGVRKAQRFKASCFLGDSRAST